MKSKLPFLILAALIAGAGALYYFMQQRPQASGPGTLVLLEKTTTLEIREDYRQGIALKPAEPFAREFRVPESGVLRFSFGIPRADWEGKDGTYRFQVAMKSPEEKVLFEQVLHPSKKKEDRNWNECSVDLSQFSRKDVRLSVSLDGGASVYLSQGKISNAAEESQRWNVVLITIDTLRRDHVSAYGYSRQTTPEMDAFARRSILFTNAISTAPLTVPSVTSILTSTYPSQHLAPNNRSSFGGHIPTLAQVLRHDGYSTAAFVCNAVLRPNRKLDAGFDLYNAFLPASEVNRRLPERTAAQLNTAALPWLHSHAAERFFLWLHYQDPHAPYIPPKEVANVFDPPVDSGKLLPRAPDETGLGGIPEYAQIPGVRDPEVYTARYDAEIRFVDSKVGEILKTIGDLKIADRTMIVITSDHGESLGEDNHYYAHGHNVTSELTDVPLIVSVPGKDAAVNNRIVSLIDIAPTVAEVTGVKAPASFQGQSLLAASDAQRYVLSEQPAVRWAAIRDTGRTIYERSGTFEYTNAGEDAEILQKWIAQNLESGCVFAISGQGKTSFRISSSERLKRTFLFQGEQGDTLEVDRDAVSVHLDAPAGDVDYLFVESSAEAKLRVEGDVVLRDGRKQNVPQEFACSAITESAKLPQASDFDFAGAIVIRKPGSTSTIRLTPEEEEELKSIGYLNN